MLLSCSDMSLKELNDIICRIRCYIKVRNWTLSALFSSFDRNNDGKISYKEFQFGIRVVVSLPDNIVSDEEIQSVWEHIRNSSGEYLAYADFSKAFSPSDCSSSLNRLRNPTGSQPSVRTGSVTFSKFESQLSQLEVRNNELQNEVMSNEYLLTSLTSKLEQLSLAKRLLTLLKNVPDGNERREYMSNISGALRAYNDDLRKEVSQFNDARQTATDLENNITESINNSRLLLQSLGRLHTGGAIMNKARRCLDKAESAILYKPYYINSIDFDPMVHQNSLFEEASSPPANPNFIQPERNQTKWNKQRIGSSYQQLNRISVFPGVKEVCLRAGVDFLHLQQQNTLNQNVQDETCLIHPSTTNNVISPTSAFQHGVNEVNNNIVASSFTPPSTTPSLSAKQNAIHSNIISTRQSPSYRATSPFKMIPSSHFNFIVPPTPSSVRIGFQSSSDPSRNLGNIVFIDNNSLVNSPPLMGSLPASIAFKPSKSSYSISPTHNYFNNQQQDSNGSFNFERPPRSLHSSSSPQTSRRALHNSPHRQMNYSAKHRNNRMYSIRSSVSWRSSPSVTNRNYYGNQQNVDSTPPISPSTPKILDYHHSSNSLEKNNSLASFAYINNSSSNRNTSPHARMNKNLFSADRKMQPVNNSENGIQEIEGVHLLTQSKDVESPNVRLTSVFDFNESHNFLKGRTESQIQKRSFNTQNNHNIDDILTTSPVRFPHKTSPSIHPSLISSRHPISLQLNKSPPHNLKRNANLLNNSAPLPSAVKESQSSSNYSPKTRGVLLEWIPQQIIDKIQQNQTEDDESIMHIGDCKLTPQSFIISENSKKLKSPNNCFENIAVIPSVLSSPERFVSFGNESSNQPKAKKVSSPLISMRDNQIYHQNNNFITDFDKNIQKCVSPSLYAASSPSFTIQQHILNPTAIHGNILITGDKQFATDHLKEISVVPRLSTVVESMGGTDKNDDDNADFGKVMDTVYQIESGENDLTVEIPWSTDSDAALSRTSKSDAVRVRSKEGPRGLDPKIGQNIESMTGEFNFETNDDDDPAFDLYFGATQNASSPFQIDRGQHLDGEIGDNDRDMSAAALELFPEHAKDDLNFNDPSTRSNFLLDPLPSINIIQLVDGANFIVNEGDMLVDPSTGDTPFRLMKIENDAITEEHEMQSINDVSNVIISQNYIGLINSNNLEFRENRQTESDSCDYSITMKSDIKMNGNAKANHNNMIASEEERRIIIEVNSSSSSISYNSPQIFEFPDQLDPFESINSMFVPSSQSDNCGSNFTKFNQDINYEGETSQLNLSGIHFHGNTEPEIHTSLNSPIQKSVVAYSRASECSSTSLKNPAASNPLLTIPNSSQIATSQQIPGIEHLSHFINTEAQQSQFNKVVLEMFDGETCDAPPASLSEKLVENNHIQTTEETLKSNNLIQNLRNHSMELSNTLPPAYFDDENVTQKVSTFNVTVPYEILCKFQKHSGQELLVSFSPSSIRHTVDSTPKQYNHIPFKDDNSVGASPTAVLLTDVINYQNETKIRDAHPSNKAKVIIENDTTFPLPSPLSKLMKNNTIAPRYNLTENMTTAGETLFQGSHQLDSLNSPGGIHFLDSDEKLYKMSSRYYDDESNKENNHIVVENEAMVNTNGEQYVTLDLMNKMMEKIHLTMQRQKPHQSNITNEHQKSLPALHKRDAVSRREAQLLLRELMQLQLKEIEAELKNDEYTESVIAATNDEVKNIKKTNMVDESSSETLHNIIASGTDNDIQLNFKTDTENSPFYERSASPTNAAISPMRDVLMALTGKFASVVNTFDLKLQQQYQSLQNHHFNHGGSSIGTLHNVGSPNSILRSPSSRSLHVNRNSSFNTLLSSMSKQSSQQYANNSSILSPNSSNAVAEKDENISIKLPISNPDEWKRIGSTHKDSSHDESKLFSFSSNSFTPEAARIAQTENENKTNFDVLLCKKKAPIIGQSVSLATEDDENNNNTITVPKSSFSFPVTCFPTKPFNGDLSGHLTHESPLNTHFQQQQQYLNEYRLRASQNLESSLKRKNYDYPLSTSLLSSSSTASLREKVLLKSHSQKILKQQKQYHTSIINGKLSHLSHSQPIYGTANHLTSMYSAEILKNYELGFDEDKQNNASHNTEPKTRPELLGLYEKLAQKGYKFK